MEKSQQNLNDQIQNLLNELNKNILKINEIILQTNTTIIQINNLISNNQKNLLNKKEINNNIKMEFNLGKFFFTKKKEIQDLFDSILENNKNESSIFQEKKEELKPKEEILSEEGLEKEAIEVVMKEGHCSRNEAVRALLLHNGDPVEALLEIGA